MAMKPSKYTNGAMDIKPKVELDDMFDDDTLDASALAKLSARYDEKDYDDVKSPQVMLAYYRHLFPFKQLFHWINQDHLPNRQWTHREFAFTLQNDVYLRYNSFANADELKKEVLRLNPARFEIGPVYSGRPKDKRTLNKATFKPLLRELVFDVDMTDYDSIRTCCSDKKICRRCWAFITMAARVVDGILRNDFGFNHLLWVYSGRRGIHCWVSDHACLSLNDDQRRAIVNYIDVIKGGAKQDKKVNLPRPLHPSVERSLAILKERFISVILQDQNCFSSEENAESLLRCFPEQGFASELRLRWKKEKYRQTSAQKWNDVREQAGDFAKDKTKSMKAKEKVSEAIQDVVLQYTYPRIDIEVSKHLNHLLKSPFCIHPATGRVCVPLASLDAIERFEPESVPTVGQLLRELESAGDAGWQKTSIKPYVDIMERHCEGIMRETAARKKTVTVKSMEF